MNTSVGLSLAIRTDTGLVRSNNEDSHGTSWLDDGTLFVIVADGMGGHAAGEVASRLAVDVIRDHVSADTSRDPRARLFDAILEANKSIISEGRRSGQRGMGTTAIVTLVRDHRAHFALVGDSRLMHVRRGHLMWRTLDHTRVQSLLDRGIIGREDARNHPDSGMLTRALGHAKMSSGVPMEPEVARDPLILEPGDVLVLSSDGLHDLVEDWEIAMAVAGETPDSAADELVAMALKRGGHDNITVAVVIAGERGSEYDAGYAAEVDGDEPPTLPTSEMSSLGLGPSVEPPVSAGPSRGPERAEGATAPSHNWVLGLLAFGAACLMVAVFGLLLGFALGLFG